MRWIRKNNPQNSEDETKENADQNVEVPVIENSEYSRIEDEA